MSQYKFDYNTNEPPLTSAEAENNAAPRGIPSGKGGQTPWNSTRSARDWLGDTPTPQPRPERPKLKMPKIPKLKKPQLNLPKSKAAKPAEKPAERPPEPPRRPERRTASPTDRQPEKRPAKPQAKPKPKAKAKRPSKYSQIAIAAISGLIFAAIVLLAECGLWGFYCYSHTLPGDTNVKASTLMYCLALFAGNFWAGAVVRRRSLKPSLIICAVFLALSLLISLNLFSWREIKIQMFLLKIVITAAAAALGFILSLAPYLINKELKLRRQRQQERRQRQLEHRQLQNQQRELEKELAQRARRL